MSQTTFEQSLFIIKNKGPIEAQNLQEQALSCDQAQDFIDRFKNSVCFLLQVSDSQDLQKSTKFIALSIFLRYLSNHQCYDDEQMGVLILCSLRLAAKFNEAFPKSNTFEFPRYLDHINIQRSFPEILQFQLFLFSQLNFKIYIKSPYDFLEQLVESGQTSTSFSNAVSSVIDLALSFIELVSYKPEQIFAGCLIATIRIKNIQDKKLVCQLQQVCGKINKANQAGNIIIQAWQNLI